MELEEEVGEGVGSGYAPPVDFKRCVAEDGMRWWWWWWGGRGESGLVLSCR